MTKAAKYKNMSASALVKTGPGRLKGFYVNSTSSGTVKFWDSTTAANAVINNTITPAVGYHDLGDVAFTIGLYVTIANTLDITLHYE